MKNDIPKVTVIIPVHNAEKILYKTVERLMNQTYVNLEIILIENGSIDNSWGVCNKIQETWESVVVYRNEVSGTTFARKKGIENAKGKYIVFCDQDDRYNTNAAIADMVREIEKDEASICQFSYFKEYHGLRKTCRTIETDLVLEKNDLYANGIEGVLGSSNSVITTTVWSKIYLASVLKEAAIHIREPLFYGEDMYLNLYAFFSPVFVRCSLCPKAYYVWKTDNGASSDNKAGEELFKEYNVIKKIMEELAENNCVSTFAISQSHIESIYFMKALVTMMIARQEEKQLILQKIELYDSSECIQMAKKYLLINCRGKSWDELDFLIGKHNCEEYYQYCILHMPRVTFREVVKRLIKKII